MTLNEDKIYREQWQSIGGLEQKHRLPYQYISKNEENSLSVHLLHLDSQQGGWKYPELCRRCSHCCINHKRTLLTRYINIRWCNIAPRNNHFLFHWSRKSQMNSSSHSSNLMKRSYLKYINPFPFENTETEDLCEERYKEIEDRWTKKKHTVVKSRQFLH